MRIEREDGWIDLTFYDYAEDAGCWRGNLIDAHNSVELGYSFSMIDTGWGVVGSEYFKTTDIAALSKGISEIQYSKRDRFFYAVLFPYKASTSELCKFEFCRSTNGITLSLCIWDGLCEYLEISQTFDEIAFAKIANEIRCAAKKFPVR